MEQRFRKRIAVGVGGQFENGKDTIADYLAVKLNELGGIWLRTAFAAAVKRVFCDTFGVDLQFVETWKRIKTPPPGFLKPVRQILVDIGDGFRSFQADVWIRRVLRYEGNLIISDARYFNELSAVKADGGLTLLVWRPGHENDDPNPSEQQLRALIKELSANPVSRLVSHPQVDAFLVNNDDRKDELFRDIDSIVVPLVLDRLRSDGLRFEGLIAATAA